MAGATITPAKPWTIRIAPACQSWSAPVRNSTPHATDASTKSAWDTWNELAAVVAVGERAAVDGEEEERHPVADDGEAAERGRVELLEDDPVADDVLDVVGHHGQQPGDEVPTIVAHVEGGEPGSERRDGGGRSGSVTRGSYHRRKEYPVVFRNLLEEEDQPWQRSRSSVRPASTIHRGCSSQGITVRCQSISSIAYAATSSLLIFEVSCLRLSP